MPVEFGATGMTPSKSHFLRVRTEHTLQIQTNQQKQQYGAQHPLQAQYYKSPNSPTAQQGRRRERVTSKSLTARDAVGQPAVDLPEELLVNWPQDEGDELDGVY